MIIGLLLACAEDPCPTGSVRQDDGLCYLTDDTGTEEVDDCAVEALGSGLAVGEASCSAGICAVPAGAFVMGDAQPESPDQCPPHTVELSAYRIDQTEVTAGQWAACEAAGVCDALPDCPSDALYDDADALPAVCMTWTEAAAYCDWAGGRLPTEAEWEKAARGEQGALWAWGSTPPSCLEANYRYVSAYCRGGVVAVGSYAAVTGSVISSAQSAFGLLDTAGNAWEWTADWYDASYYRTAPEVDPPGPTTCSLTVDAPPDACLYRVMRGGGYNSTQDVIRGTARSFASPEHWDVNIGFRCAYDAP